MRVYEGERGQEGAPVTVDGVPLAQRLDIKAFSKTGFEWIYAGPRQLSEAFMQGVVAHLDNAWRLDGAEIDVALAAIGQKACSERVKLSGLGSR